MSTSADTPRPELTVGSLAFLHGYKPVVVFGYEDDLVEVAQFGSFDYVDVGDLSLTERGPKPAAALPEPVSPQDRVVALEAQVADLTAAIKLLTERLPSSGADTPPAPEAPPETPPPSPSPAPAFPFAPAGSNDPAATVTVTTPTDPSEGASS